MRKYCALCANIAHYAQILRIMCKYCALLCVQLCATIAHFEHNFARILSTILRKYCALCAQLCANIVCYMHNYAQILHIMHTIIGVMHQIFAHYAHS